MRAAVVHSFDRPPRCEERAEPVPAAGEVVVDVVASALHPRVRSAANGTHDTSDGALPMVPGVDGVGRAPGGGLVYFVLHDTPAGAMAERVAIDPRRSVPLPAGADPVVLAAAMNPAMSAWVALRRRIAFAPGGAILVLGATGSAGRLAVELARHLGAATVVGAGRDPERLAALPALGADRTVALGGDPERAAAALADTAADVDVVLDYLWGDVTAWAIPALLRARADRGRPLDWVQIGSMAGLSLPLESQWLRAARLQLVGSGQGSVPIRDIVAELPQLAAHLTAGGCAIDARAVPLADVEAAWTRPAVPGERLVLVP